MILKAGMKVRMHGERLYDGCIGTVLYVYDNDARISFITKDGERISSWNITKKSDGVWGADNEFGHITPLTLREAME